MIMKELLYDFESADNFSQSSDPLLSFLLCCFLPVFIARDIGISKGGKYCVNIWIISTLYVSLVYQSISNGNIITSYCESKKGENNISTPYLSIYPAFTGGG